VIVLLFILLVCAFFVGAGVILLIAILKGVSSRRPASVGRTQAAKFRVACPSCRTVLISPAGRARCSACRKILFVRAPPPQHSSLHQPIPQPGSLPPPATRSPATRGTRPLRANGLAAVGLGALLIVGLIFSLRSGVNRATNAESRSKDSSTAKSVPAAIGVARVGESVTIAPGPSWPCAPSKASLPELMKLQVLMLDENVPNSVMDRLANSLMRTKSIMIGSRDTVTILEIGPGIRKVSVSKRKPSGGGYMRDAEAGCWIAQAAIGGR
jgi:hypothetical protein